MKSEPHTKKERFSLAQKDEAMEALVNGTGHRTLAVWAIDCTLRVLPFFGEHYPDDSRPRDAIATLRAWIATGVFRMVVIRGASLAAHAAARDVGEDSPCPLGCPCRRPGRGDGTCPPACPRCRTLCPSGGLPGRRPRRMPKRLRQTSGNGSTGTCWNCGMHRNRDSLLTGYRE